MEERVLVNLGSEKYLEIIISSKFFIVFFSIFLQIQILNLPKYYSFLWFSRWRKKDIEKQHSFLLLSGKLVHIFSSRNLWENSMCTGLGWSTFWTKGQYFFIYPPRIINTPYILSLTLELSENLWKIQQITITMNYFVFINEFPRTQRA